MKNLSKKWKIALGSVVGVFVAIIMFIAYLNIEYSDVESSVRLKGYIIEKTCKFDTKEEMIKYSNHNRETTAPVDVDDHIRVEEKMIKGRDGNEIRVMVFSNKNVDTSDAIGLLWIHGGGYAFGAPDKDGLMINEFMNAENTVVIAPDYRLSTSAPYPAALNDCYDSLLWMKENAKELGINDEQLFVAGASAGGGLTAATTLYARDMNEVNIAFQIPIYPMINSRMDLPSAIGNEEFLWNSKRNKVAWQLYLGDLYMTDDIPKYASPSEETNYEGLPPTYTYVGTLDPFYDETIQYVNELKADGVEVTHDIYEGGYHGFDVIGMIGTEGSLSKTALQKLVETYQYAAKTYKAPQK